MHKLHEARLSVHATIWRRRARGVARNGRALVLYYHRIAAPALDPWQTSVSPSTFEEHLDFLASELRVISLGDLAEAHRRGKIPDRSVAITFDDGYVDNLEQGLPRLERRSLPAVFYIPTGLIDRPGAPWWDEIADLLLGSGERPAALDVEIGDTRVQAPTRSPAEREHALHAPLTTALKRLPPERIDTALEPLRAWAGKDPGQPSIAEDGISEPRVMTAAELERLAAAELTEIGAHTALHPSLPKLDRSAQRVQIEASRDMLAEVIGTPPRSFAYPFGENTRVSRATVREAGFDHAVGVQEYAPVTTASLRFEIPRMMPREEPAAELEKRMNRIFDLVGSR